MVKLIMWNLMSLDGYFNGKVEWELDFHNEVWGEELEKFSIEQLKEIGTLIFGRITFVGMAKYWTNESGEIADYMRKIDKIVFSKTLENLDAFNWDNSKLLTSDLLEEVNSLKKESIKDIFVFGSADLSNTLIKERLFDEYRICIAPVLLGQGTPLFKPNGFINKLKFSNSQILDTGGLILTYKPLN